MVSVFSGVPILDLNASIGNVDATGAEEGEEAVCVRAVEYGGEIVGRKSCRVFIEAKEGCNFWNNYNRKKL